MILVDKLSSIELKRYSKLSLDEIKTLLLELGKIPQNELSISDARVIARLHIMYDIFTRMILMPYHIFSGWNIL